MGGYSSGRHGGRPTVEGSKSITVTNVMGACSTAPRQGWHSTMTWTDSYTGERTFHLALTTVVDGDRGWVRLTHKASRWGGPEQTMDYQISLRAVAQPFGGRRWWFVCPFTFRSVTRLYLPNGALTFASRQAYRLGYRSQRETPRDRALAQAFKRRRRLGAEGGIGDPVFRPKGMHQTTYDRHMSRIEDLEAICNLNLIAAARRLGIRFGNPADKL